MNQTNLEWLKQKLTEELAPIAKSFSGSDLHWHPELLKEKREVLKNVAKRVLLEYLEREGRKIVGNERFFLGEFWGYSASYAVDTELQDGDPNHERNSFTIEWGYNNDEVTLLGEKYDREDYDEILTVEVELLRQFSVTEKGKSVEEYDLSIYLRVWVNPHPEWDHWDY